MSDIYKRIGFQVRKLREDARLSQSALANEIGVTANTISRWETATYQLTIGDVQTLADFFKVSLSFFFQPEGIELQQELLAVIEGLPAEDIKEIILYAEFWRTCRRI